ncbi:MAG: phage tail tape measure protein, partial [Bacilli bacterium]|nr:phage tail tape measure protein [Bacilli bacterium]
MAKNIKGITIEIGGNTTKLQDALKDVNKVIYSTNSELKGLKQALAIDPKNVELLAQKQEVLKKNIQETTNKLNTLKEAQRQMGDYNKLTDEQKEAYRALSVEITKTKGYLSDMNKELKNTNSIDLGKVGDGLKKVGDIAADVIKKVTQVT